MTSLAILILIFVVSILFTVWVLATMARILGSPRGRLRYGFLAVAGMFGIFIVTNIAAALVHVQGPWPTLGAGGVLVIVQLTVVFYVLRGVFALTTKRTFVMVGVYIGLGIVQWVLALGVIRPFILEAFVMPTASMTPTIQPGDRFAANKLLKPRRWDLVAYRSTEPSHMAYCKRLIGFPGERLRFENGSIYINDQLMAAPAVIAGKCHANVGNLYQDGQTISLGSRDYFFIGDNTDFSADSRAWGPTDAADIIGVIDLFYWPIKHARIIPR